MSAKLRPCEIPGCRTLTLRERCQYHRTGVDGTISTAERIRRQQEDRQRERDPLMSKGDKE
jgi:hypothetical protein